MAEINSMALTDIAIFTSLGKAEGNFRNIMLLARQLQTGHVIDAGTLKTIEDLLFVARVELADVIVEAINRLDRYRELAQSTLDAVSVLEAESVDATWPQVISVRPDYRPSVANDQAGGAA